MWKNVSKNIEMEQVSILLIPLLLTTGLAIRNIFNENLSGVNFNSFGTCLYLSVHWKMRVLTMPSLSSYVALQAVVMAYFANIWKMVKLGNAQSIHIQLILITYT